MQLSMRLSAISDMVTAGNRVIDVGTDHAYLPISLIVDKKIPSAIAMDIRTGPLEHAKAHIRAYGLEEYIETRLSDGVQALEGTEGDTLVIAGMGGALVMKILSEGVERLAGIREFILQPQSEQEEVRRFLKDHAYVIREERMIEEDGKYYPMMKVIRKDRHIGLDDRECEERIHFRYGRMLLEQRDETLKRYLEKQRETYEKIQAALQRSDKEETRRRLSEVREELAGIDRALQYFREGNEPYAQR